MRNLKRAMTMLSELMNETFEMYAGTDYLNVYEWGWRKFNGVEEGGTIGPNHGNTFYRIDKIIDVLRANNVSYYLTITKNADGEPTPGIEVF